MKIRGKIQTLHTEVFRTNVKSKEDASYILDRIHDNLIMYAANFDLDDCDHILRIQSFNEINSDAVITVVLQAGHWAEVLPDVIDPPVDVLLVN